MLNPEFIIGIDLGTTNSIVAFTEAEISDEQKHDDRIPEITVLDIPQIISDGVVDNRSIFPSFIYLPGSHEISDSSMSLPWNHENKTIVGEFARERGAEVPQRLISSSKSWLCNVMIDRNKPVLPWNSPDDISKMSPVESSSMILQHIRDVWNHLMASEDDRRKIENQEIFLTVPASFDAVARELTLKAARLAGLSNVTLLEEPQAAFYSWIEASKDQWRKKVKKGDRVLVCDVGGGTSDFSLIHVTEDNGDLVLERVAVGDHLLVGGDNMDLALAYSIAKKMADSGTRLDSWQMRGLVHSCRKAKEKILSDSETEEHPVTILGRGSSLIGGTIKSFISKDEIENSIINGFFPACEITSIPMKTQKIGLAEAGLSYESDPAVSRHLANFLNHQKNDTGDSIALPTAVFFNGGVMKSDKVREHIIRMIDSWGTKDGSDSIREIHSDDFDLAVARGAAYYGLARRGRGVRIRGGLGRSYYIGIAASMPAVPGMPVPVKALCVASFGMEEGTDINLKNQEFVLAVGEPVRFELLCSSTRKKDATGEIVEDWQDEIEEITSIETTLDGEYGQFVRVTIEIKVTEIGTLELWCVSVEDEQSGEDEQKWKLEFNVREQD
ncbi:MAG: Hsp70 family protein [Desulfobacteraceae bacterium]|nr:Hsp70 family protein [Desulfobacteraceae bacterium]MBC2756496.1 Hsp70 family protein [Desulfobacteraceae bacterium]